jgi:hypothetical protein
MRENEMDEEKFDITVFVDESGSITKTDIEHHKYFVIAMLFTDNSSKIKTRYRRGISNMIQKNEKLQNMLKDNGEIKGSSVSDTKKMPIYESIIKYDSDKFEIGIIVLDNTYTDDNFIKNHARTFNYMIQMYLDKHFRYNSIYSGKVNNMHFIIDEQNIATDAKYTLDGYLNQHLNLMNTICNNIDVIYSDSKNHSLIQLVDFIANSFFRNLEKNNRETRKTIPLLLPKVCGSKIFDFSSKHDTHLNLDE